MALPQAKLTPLSVEDSPAVIRQMIRDLEHTILDNKAQDVKDNERLSFLEKELVSRKQAEIERNLERAEVERELLGATRERLREIQAEQRQGIDRLEAEQAALSAKRGIIQAEILAMENSVARSTTEVEAASKLLNGKSPIKKRFFAFDSEASLGQELAKLGRNSSEKEDEGTGSSADLMRKLEEVAAERLEATGDWDSAALLDAWLTGDPNGIFREEPAQSAQVSPEEAYFSHADAPRADEFQVGEAVAAQIAKLRTKLLEGGGPKCAAALRSLIEAERLLMRTPPQTSLPPCSVHTASQTTLGDPPEKRAATTQHEQQPLSMMTSRPSFSNDKVNSYGFEHEPIRWQEQQNQQQQIQFLQQQLQFMQQQQLDRMMYQQAQLRNAEEKAHLETEIQRLQAELGRDGVQQMPARATTTAMSAGGIGNRAHNRRVDCRKDNKDRTHILLDASGGDEEETTKRMTEPSVWGSRSSIAQAAADDEDEVGFTLDDLKLEQRRELAALDFEITKLRKSERLKSLKVIMEHEREEEKRKRAHDNWLESQRRRIQALRVDKALAVEEKESGIDPFLPDVFLSYAPLSGFGIRFDFAIGQSNRHRTLAGESQIKNVRVVYALYDGPDPAMGLSGKPQATRWAPYADWTSKGIDRGIAIFALGGADGAVEFAEVNASQSVKVVMEVQADCGAKQSGSTSKKEVESLGWASVPVFAAGLAPPSVDDGAVVPGPRRPSKGQEHSTLAAGAWQLPVIPGTFSKDARWPPAFVPRNCLMLHARIYFGSAPPALSAVDPFCVYSLYHTWGSASRLRPLEVSPALIEKALPSKLIVRVHTVEALNGADWPGEARTVIASAYTTETLWTSTSVLLEAQAGWMASWTQDASFEVPVDGPGRVHFSLKAAADDTEFCDGDLEIMDNDGCIVSKGDAAVLLRVEPNEKAAVARLNLTIEANEGVSADKMSSAEAMVDEELRDGFLDVRRPEPTKIFRRGEGVDLFVDGARGLPDNAGASKVTVKLVAQGEVVGDAHSALAELDGARFAPKFNLVAEFRCDEFDPTSTLVFRVDALEEHAESANELPPSSERHRQDDTQPKAVGYALLNLFCASGNTRKQPTSRDTQSYCLVAGGFQLPLYRAKPPIGPDLRFDSLEAQPRVTCATLLVRVEHALTKRTETGVVEVLSRKGLPRSEWSSRGFHSPAPSYASQAYDSSRCAPTSIERRLYERRRHSRCDPGLRSGHVKPDANVKDLEVALDRRPTTFLPPWRASPYYADHGFAIAVDGLNHMPARDCFYKVVTVISPPGLYFRVPSVADDAQFTVHHDLDAAVEAPRYKDPPLTFVNKNTHRALAAFFEIRPLHAIKDKRTAGIFDVCCNPESYFWTVLPIWCKPCASSPDGAFYVDSGAFLLPLLRGPVPPAALQADNVWDCILHNLVDRQKIAPRRAKNNAETKKRKDGRPPFDLADHGESLLVRLVDANLEDLRTFVPPSRKEYVVKAAAAANLEPHVYSFDYSSNATARRPARKLIPRTLSDKALDQILVQTFSEITGIHHHVT